MFHKIDMAAWPRREHYAYYSGLVKTSYQLQAELDVTALRAACKAQGVRFYPAMLHAIMQAVNADPAFRMAVDGEGELGYYDVCHPSYTIFHPDDETFSDIWTEYTPDFAAFYRAACADMETYRDVKGIKAKPVKPAAFTPVSCVPWLHFTALSHDTPGPSKMYFPVITFGKYEQSGEKWTLPLSVFVNHAVADGFHTARLLNRVQAACTDCAAWLHL